MDSITFMSYNSTGLDSTKISFSIDICDIYDVDFMSIQEHFKFVNADKVFKSGFKDFSSFVIPAHRSTGQMSGRAKAGLAQLCRNNYDVKKTRVNAARFLKVCRYDQLRCNSCYDEFGCNNLVVIALLLRPA